MKSVQSPQGGRLDATRHSLIGRLGDLGDQRRWQEFFDTYWRLIYGVARKAGLRDDEAQEVVQDTVITVSKSITRYEREAGPFKPWLLQIVRWRIAERFRKRPVVIVRGRQDGSRRGTATIERVPDATAHGFDALWDEEWRRNLLDSAIDRVKQRVNARTYQIFDCMVNKHWSATKTAAELRVNIAQVYLAKHRVAALLKKEIAIADKDGG